jgi:uncharacterized damage-inducible protein DinB
MISPEHVRTFARYGAWQNASLTAAADGLSAAERAADRGAFFGSIQATLNHLLWADRIWMHRLAGTRKPQAHAIADSPRETEDWPDYMAQRKAMDATTLEWAEALRPGDLAGDLTWQSVAAGREIAKPLWFVVAHMFNHGTHHRGQVHAMLTAAGARPDDTDLFLLPPVA